MDGSNMSYLLAYLHELQEIYSIPASDWAQLAKSAKAAEAMKELMWQNGQILLHLYTVLFEEEQGTVTEVPAGSDGEEEEQVTVTEVPAPGAEQEESVIVVVDNNDMEALFKHPNFETTSFGRDPNDDFFDFGPTVTPPASPPFAAFFESQSPPPQQPGEQDSVQFSGLASPPSVDSVTAPPVAAAVEPTVVYVTPVAATGATSLNSFYQAAAAGGEFRAVGASASRFSASQQRRTLAAGKAIVVDDSESEDNSPRAEKQARRSEELSKKARAAKVHNLTERRRRDKINEKMKILQEMIPNCNKADKASMLDDAIVYMKSLQLQIKQLSDAATYGMAPMMHHGMQQYMPGMGMQMAGMGMNMPMGMNPTIMPMGMNPTMMPYSSTMPPSSSMPNPATAVQMSPGFTMPTFQPPQVPFPNPFMAQASNMDPYQQFLSVQQAQLLLAQNLAAAQVMFQDK